MATISLKSFSALRQPAYRRFWSGHVISVLGGAIQSTGLSWLVYRLTSSSTALGIASLTIQAPILFLGLIGGILADRLSRRRLLLIYNYILLVLAIWLAVVARSDAVSIHWIYAVCFIQGVVTALEIPARQTWIKDLTGVKDLASGIALNSIAFNLGRMIGPPIAGWIIYRLGESYCFGLNALSFVAALLAIVSLPPDVPAGAKPDSDESSRAPSLTAVLSSPIPRSILLLITVLSFFGLPISNMLPVYARDIYHRGPEGLGLLNGAGGLGSILGAFLASIKDPSEFRYRDVLVGFSSYALFYATFALGLPYPVALAGMVGLGASLLYTLIHANHLLQTRSPDQYRGRVISAYSSLVIGVTPFGSMFLGSVADRIPIQSAVACHAVVLVVFCLFRWYRYDAAVEAAPVAPAPGKC